MFNFAWRKMLKNRWLTISLLIGYIMAVAIVSSMPLYSHAILNRLLLKDLETIQTDTGVYPGRVSVEQTLSARDAQTRIKGYDNGKDIVLNRMLPDFGLPVQQKVNMVSISNLNIAHENGERMKSGTAILAGLSGIEEHVQLLGGSLPSGTVGEDGVYEAMISETASQKLNLGLGSTYQLQSSSLLAGASKSELVATVRITAIFQEGENTDAYWVTPSSELKKAILIDYDLFLQDFLYSESSLVSKSNWYFALDYSAFTIENCDHILEQVEYYDNSRNFAPTVRTAFYSTLEKYAARMAALTATLWIIEIPILLMLLLYIFMVTRLILDHEKSEIAVLRSRGTSGGQIVLLYLMQSAILAGIAFILGPLLGMMFCKIVGASDGFMSFVNRAGLKVELTAAGWGYAALTAVVLVVTMLISVVFNKDASIVTVKRKKSRSTKPLWQKLYLDVVCLLVALYGLYSYQNRLKALEAVEIDASEVPVDFLLYGASTLFILGCTLLFLRLFPLLVSLLYRLGEKKWRPVLYLTLSQVSRGGAANLTISLFLIFTLSMGVFNSVMVRTLNRNQEDRVQYTIGADVVLQEEWPSIGGGAGSSDMMAAAAEETEKEEVYYTEPQFSRYEQLETVESAARVLTMRDISVSANSKKEAGVTVMGIVPDEFGKVCWYRNDLAPYHLNEYLNLLADEPRAVLMSSNLMETFGISPGDTAYISVPGNPGGIQVVVYAAIDYFSTFNPKEYNGRNLSSLVVANLTYLQQEMKLRPYKIWLRKAEGVSSQELYDELDQKGIRIRSLSDTTVQLVRLKNDAVVQGTNGFFTLSFLVTMMITFIGFFIYWILAIQARRLQFGILRSMGMSKGSVMMVLLWEQILVSVTAALVGIGLGTLTAELYAPFLECGVNASEQILPYIVVGDKGDYLLIILIVAVMLAVAAAVLARIVDRFKAGEALKLGED